MESEQEKTVPEVPPDIIGKTEQQARQLLAGRLGEITKKGRDPREGESWRVFSTQIGAGDLVSVVMTAQPDRP